MPMLSRLFRINTKLFLLLAFCCLLTSCSSKLRMLDYWTSEDFREYEEMKFMVVCVAEDPEIRDDFEYEIAKKLKKRNIQAGESHKIFPTLKPANSEEEKERYREIIRESGYNGVVLTTVKNIIESYKEGVEVMALSTGEVNPEHLSLTYVIEAQVIDLSRSVENEMVGVNLVAVTDPASGEELVNSYSRIIGRHFKNKDRQ